MMISKFGLCIFLPLSSQKQQANHNAHN